MNIHNSLVKDVKLKNALRVNEKNTANREPNLTRRQKSYPCLVSKIPWYTIVAVKVETGILDTYMQRSTIFLQLSAQPQISAHLT